MPDVCCTHEGHWLDLSLCNLIDDWLAGAAQEQAKPEGAREQVLTADYNSSLLYAGLLVFQTDNLNTLGYVITYNLSKHKQSNINLHLQQQYQDSGTLTQSWLYVTYR